MKTRCTWGAAPRPGAADLPLCVVPVSAGSSGTQQQIASLPPRVQQLQQQHQNLQKDAGKPKGSGSGSGSKCFFYKNTECVLLQLCT